MTTPDLGLDNHRHHLIQLVKKAGKLESRFIEKCHSPNGYEALKSLVVGSVTPQSLHLV